MKTPGAGQSRVGTEYFRPIFAEDGRLLTVEAEAAHREAEQQQHQQQQTARLVLSD